MDSVSQTEGLGDTQCLFLNSTPGIQNLLGEVSRLAELGCLPSALALEAVNHNGAAKVPYPLLRDLWRHLHPSHVGHFHQLVAGTTFFLESPAPRVKSPELLDRLSKLQDLADRKEYDALVSDITVPQKEYFSSYKHQLGFGLHVIATMFTCFMVGYGIFRALFQNSPVTCLRARQAAQQAGARQGAQQAGVRLLKFFFICSITADRPSKIRAHTTLGDFWSVCVFLVMVGTSEVLQRRAPLRIV